MWSPAYYQCHCALSKEKLTELLDLSVYIYIERTKKLLPESGSFVSVLPSLQCYVLMIHCTELQCNSKSILTPVIPVLNPMTAKQKPNSYRMQDVSHSSHKCAHRSTVWQFGDFPLVVERKWGKKQTESSSYCHHCKFYGNFWTGNSKTYATTANKKQFFTTYPLFLITPRHLTSTEYLRAHTGLQPCTGTFSQPSASTSWRLSLVRMSESL